MPIPLEHHFVIDLTDKPAVFDGNMKSIQFNLNDPKNKTLSTAMENKKKYFFKGIDSQIELVSVTVADRTDGMFFYGKKFTSGYLMKFEKDLSGKGTSLKKYVSQTQKSSVLGKEKLLENVIYRTNESPDRVDISYSYKFTTSDNGKTQEHKYVFVFQCIFKGNNKDELHRKITDIFVDELRDEMNRNTLKPLTPMMSRMPRPRTNYYVYDGIGGGGINLPIQY